LTPGASSFEPVEKRHPPLFRERRMVRDRADAVAFEEVVVAHREVRVVNRQTAVDATCLAPRSTMVRIATGRDAADTAFLTASGDPVDLISLEVTAVTDEALPDDDLTRPAQLG
jgi:predicted lipid carrier protein YhbT